MTRRTRAREVALQLLYAADLNPGFDCEAADAFIQERLGNQEDLASLARTFVTGVRRNQAELDAAIVARTENWSLERMSVIDRNLLRIGTFEMLYMDTPPRVAINEAVELAKRYGTKESSRFVNGILDRIWHDLLGAAGGQADAPEED